MNAHPPPPPSQFVPLPPSVEDAIRRICIDQNQPPPNTSTRRKLASLDEEAALRVLRSTAATIIKYSIDGLISRIIENGTGSSPSPSPSKVARVSLHDQSPAGSPVVNSRDNGFASFPVRDQQIGSLRPLPSLEDGNGQAVSPHMKALSEMEFRKAFLILNYIGEGNLEDAIDSDRIRVLKDLSMIEFEEVVWNEVGQFHVKKEDRCKELDLFNVHEWTCTEDNNRYKKIVEAERLYAFLAGLRDEFDEVRGRILGKQPLPPIGEVFSEVQREESRRGIMLGKAATGGKDGPLEGSALATSEDKKSRVPATIVSEANASKISANLRKTDGRPRVWCDVCNKPRHTRETCWRIHGRPASFSRDNKISQRVPPTANEATSFPFNKEQLDHLLHLLSAKAGSMSGNPTASVAHQGSDLGEDDWQC